MLDRIFDALTPPDGSDPDATTRYDTLLDTFDRADDVRRIRDGCSRQYRGKESRAQEAAAKERREENIDAELSGEWGSSTAVPTSLPDREPYITQAKLVLTRLQEIDGGDMTPQQRVIARVN